MSRPTRIATDPLKVTLPDWIDTNHDYRLTWSEANEAWVVLPLDVMLRKDAVTVIEDIGAGPINLSESPF